MYKEYNKVQLTEHFTKNSLVDSYLVNLGFTPEDIHYILNPPAQHSYKKLYHACNAAKFLHTRSLLANKARIHVVGDYDADGVTSTSILVLTLRHLGFDVDYTIPHRIHDGYGLSTKLVDKIATDPTTRPDILITCDNGIVALDAIRAAKAYGLTVIVTDHHTPNDDLHAIMKAADYVIHPQIGLYPFPDISGATVAYKFAQAMLAEFAMEDEKLMDYLLQLAAISVVSDVMPIASKGELASKNENRDILQRGIALMKKQPDWHIKMMFDMFKLDYKHLDETMIGFYVAPVINAVGRLTDARTAVEMFLAKDEQTCILQCSMMGWLNEERKKLKKECMEKIQPLIDYKKKVIVVKEEGIHEGIIGILAGNICNDTNRPTMVFTSCEIDGYKVWKGSCRSVDGFNIYDFLSEIHLVYPGMIRGFGGHAGAAGISIDDENMDAFMQAVDDKVNTMKMPEVTKYHLTVQGSDIDKFARALQEIKPMGNGLPKPFVKCNMVITQFDFYFASRHVKLSNVFHNELWLYNELDNFVAEDANFVDFTKTFDNTLKRMSEYGLPEEEARAGHSEKWNCPNGQYPAFSFYCEVDYGSMMGRLTPIFSVQDYKRFK